MGFGVGEGLSERLNSFLGRFRKCKVERANISSRFPGGGKDGVSES